MTKKSSKELLEQDKNYYLQAFKRYPVVLERGKGAQVWDIKGNQYLDALAGIAVNSIGHAHPDFVKAVSEQLGKLVHISNFYLSRAQAKLSKELAERSGMQRVFLANSGTEAVEGAFKLARKYAHKNGRGGNIISFSGSFHGRTLAAIASGKKQMQKGFDPIPQGFMQVPFNDIEAVKKASDKNTAAVIIEPVQGEGGINCVDSDFLRELRNFCTRENIVLIFDEIQCGICRTGKFLAKDHYGIQPDIITLAKALGGGIPIGAFLASETVGEAIDYGDHGTTFGGNPLASRAALAVLDIIDKEELCKQSEKKGNLLTGKIAAINDSRIKEIRGKGLMIGIEFSFETKALVTEMLNRGVLANSTAGNVLRLVPPLIISEQEIDSLVQVLSDSLKAV